MLRKIKISIVLYTYGEASSHKLAQLYNKNNSNLSWNLRNVLYVYLDRVYYIREPNNVFCELMKSGNLAVEMQSFSSGQLNINKLYSLCCFEYIYISSQCLLKTNLWWFYMIFLNCRPVLKKLHAMHRVSQMLLCTKYIVSSGNCYHTFNIPFLF